MLNRQENQLISTRFITTVVLLIAMLFSRVSVATNQDSLQIRLQSNDAEHVVVSLQNSSADEISILAWGSPFEPDLTQDLFAISSVDEPGNAAFRGRLIKREMPLPEDFITLAAGETIDAIVPIVRLYDLAQFGEYRIELKWTLQYLNNNNELSSVTLVPAPLTATLSPQPGVRAAIDPDFESCSADRQSTIQLAMTAAEQMALTARDGLAGLSNDGRRNSPRYTQWFGSYEEQRFNKVLDTFEQLNAVLASETLRFNCDCDDSGYFAYVFPSQPYNVYLCPAFWRASMTGRDSKAGTILHELTHFPQVSGTSDHAYATAAVELAIEQPELAVNNADSYEYFAENVPKLDIFNGVVFSELTLGNEVAAWLSARQSSFYKVPGAEYIELISDSGNADMVIYQSAATEIIVCDSKQIEGADRCEVNPDRTAYIEVTAVDTGSNYRLIADVEPIVVVQTGDPADDDPGNPQEPADTPDSDTGDSQEPADTPDSDTGDSQDPGDPQEPTDTPDTDPVDPSQTEEEDVSLGSTTPGMLLFLLLINAGISKSRRRSVH